MSNMISIHPVNPDKRTIRRAAYVLSQGGVIVYPTDTVYGIGCDITKKNAIERIVQIKARTLKKPFSFICSDLKHISHYAEVTDSNYRILKRFLPGPYTFILPATKYVPQLLRAKQKTVGIRIPDHPVTLALVQELGNPLLSTSANLTGDDVITDPDEIERVFGKLVDMILQCGMLSNTPSSVVSLADNKVEVLRKGTGDVSYFS
ncbi:MAG TPA: L-threonylcarbamoyladenylate synthase [Thermodesulfovibrionia bacterium]|nr:L-threonylcarbamoyladenylate synthase [Thermodesulfovibrionia bacterium]